MRPDGVVVVLPESKRFTRVVERAEQGLVQQLVPEPAVEALDEGVLGRLAGCDVMPLDFSLLSPA